MSFIGPKTPELTAEMFEELKTTNADWVGLIPEATLDRATLTFQSELRDHVWWGGTIAANVESIQLAKQAGFKVFLKPHIVLGKIPTYDDIESVLQRVGPKTFRHGREDLTDGVEWRGELHPKRPVDLLIWESSYEQYILQLAQIAQDWEVDLFAIGTELKKSAWKRPEFWRQLIQKVRAIYQGPITYAANWDEYQKITFWDELDYIGVDTYFPVSRKATPDLKSTLKNWRPIKKQLKKFSKSVDRPILLTEFGYRNVNYAGKRPWTHDKVPAVVNNQAQANLYAAFFQTFWEEPWVVGGFAWKWFAEPKRQGNTSFSVRGKPALKMVQEWYGKEKHPDNIYAKF
ncbi:MAG: hypothetical protein AAGJ18_02630 [Bacteroidota bacterium]